MHIPRTGGQSIEAFFGQTSDAEKSGKNRIKHFRLDQYLDLDETARSYFKFTFVRNTWDLMVSVWLFITTHPTVSRNFRGLTLVEFLSDDFPSKLQKVIEDKSRWDFALVNILRHSQLYWIDERLDLVGRFENLEGDFRKIGDRVGMEHAILPHNNRTQRSHYHHYYDNQTREIVRNRYAGEIERFGFEF